MQTANIFLDFSKPAGEIKPLHGVNNSPMALYEPPKGFAEAGIPFCRLHDACGAFGGTHFVDVPNIFPNFNADPADPNAYDFAFTDAYIQQLNASGTEIFYRLGVTIENNHKIRAYHNHPPRDFNKWAEICAGIVRHYNEGWAKGFHLNIKYWEIWNEPENPPMWSGSKEEFFQLYGIAARRLKKEFPYIRVGGYAGCGFYAINRPNQNDFYKSFIRFFDGFLAFVTAPETQAPLDFFSWHLYTSTPQEIVLHAEYAAKKLKEYGLHNVENIFNEWNYMSANVKRRFMLMKEAEGASFVAAAFALMQNSPIDKAMFYDAYPQRSYCGLYFFPSMECTPTFYSFLAFNELYKLKYQFSATCDLPQVTVCAAANKGETAILLANTGDETVKLNFNDVPNNLKLRITDRGHTFAQMPFDPQDFTLPPQGTALLHSTTLTLPEDPAEINNVHAGLAQ